MQISSVLHWAASYPQSSLKMMTSIYLMKPGSIALKWICTLLLLHLLYWSSHASFSRISQRTSWISRNPKLKLILLCLSCSQCKFWWRTRISYFQSSLTPWSLVFSSHSRQSSSKWSRFMISPLSRPLTSVVHFNLLASFQAFYVRWFWPRKDPNPLSPHPSS